MFHSVSYRIKSLFVIMIMAVYVCSPVIVLAQEVSSDASSAETQPVVSAPSSEATPEPTAQQPAPAPVQSTPTEPAPGPTVTAPAPTTTTTEQSSSVATPATTGPTQPTGADSNQYTYNTQTGLWENAYYTWDPVTKQTKPKTEQTYSYNPSTGMWDTTNWYYSPESGKYLPNTVSISQNPYAPDALASINGTGPGSSNNVDLTGNTSGTFDLFFNATISNKIGQMSKSGNALVQGNTFGGNATSGDAQSLLNLLNMIQSSWGGLGSQDIALFMANIDGDVVGDLYVDPNAMAAQTGTTNLDVTVSQDAAIKNDVDVEVASGNATVTHNTEGGNATTGRAQAVVNLLNMINSAINANKSFIGVLNINGSLNGDILLPPEMLKAIIAASGPSSNNQITGNNTADIDLAVNQNKVINNDITTDVASGNASVARNTTAGSASTGDASSNVVLLNLTGRKVVAKNAMLVFVNVMGSWVGLILDAPAGTTAVAVTGPDSNNTINSTNTLYVDADIAANSLINNDIHVAAKSGDASVTGNTKGGNATSGDADVGVNVLNMIDSEFNVTDWFGVLFINVFGEWVGSFGVNTMAGNQPAGGKGTGPTNSTMATAEKPTGVFGFVSKSSTSDGAAGSSRSQAPNGVLAAQEAKESVSPEDSRSSSEVLAPATGFSDTGGGSTRTQEGSANLWLAGAVTLSGVFLLGGERLVTFWRSRQPA